MGECENMLFSRLAGVREHAASCVLITAEKCTTWFIVQAFYKNDNYAATHLVV